MHTFTMVLDSWLSILHMFVIVVFFRLSWRILAYNIGTEHQEVDAAVVEVLRSG